MSGNMIPFGECGGQLLQADEVANGLRCVRPKCHRALVAANEGTKVFPYFPQQQSASEGGHPACVTRRAIELILAELPELDRKRSGERRPSELMETPHSLVCRYSTRASAHARHSSNSALAGKRRRLRYIHTAMILNALNGRPWNSTITCAGLQAR
jgi:hypothetical protein